MKNNRFSKRTGWYAAIFIIINLIAVLALSRKEAAYVDNSLTAHADTTKSEMEEVMQNYIHSFQLFTHILTQEIEAHPDPDDIWDYLKSIDSTMLGIEGDTFDGLYMYYKGRYLYSWDTPYSEYESTGYVATERPWYKDAAAGNGSVVFTPPYMSYANHYILSTISQLQPDGETVFAYDIKMGNIQKLVTARKSYSGEQMMVFDNKGTVIGSTDESYLGGNLYASADENKDTLEEAEKALKNAGNVSETQKEKLKEEVDSAKSFYEFHQGFDSEFQKLSDEEETTLTVKLDNKKYYGYLLHGDDYNFLILVPVLSMLKSTMQIWLLPLLAIEILLIYILARISRDRKNRELQAAYVELGQTQKRLEIALNAAQKAAAIDDLTGMMNFKSFRKGVTELLDSMYDDESGILIMIDGDHFKTVNDNYGHQVGDEVIKLSAQMIIGRIRTIDLASRLHGDEFAIFVSNTDDYNVAKRIMQDINKTLAQEAKRRNMPSITLSAGAVVARQGDTYTALSKIADEALYKAKETHNGGFAGAENL